LRRSVRELRIAGTNWFGEKENPDLRKRSGPGLLLSVRVVPDPGFDIEVYASD
jgi:hypothetical protein